MQTKINDDVHLAQAATPCSHSGGGIKSILDKLRYQGFIYFAKTKKDPPDSS